jgi:HSP20 family protein
MTSLQREMNRLLESFFDTGQTRALATDWWPAVDVVETPETFVVKAELPGIEAKDIDIAVMGDTLMIKGERKEEKEEKGKTFLFRELRVGKFARSIPLPISVDPKHVEAVNREGVLEITMAKRPEAKPQKIPVKVAH